jgi:hypothetical protein
MGIEPTSLRVQSTSENTLPTALTGIFNLISF